MKNEFRKMISLIVSGALLIGSVQIPAEAGEDIAGDPDAVITESVTVEEAGMLDDECIDDMDSCDESFADESAEASPDGINEDGYEIVELPMGRILSEGYYGPFPEYSEEDVLGDGDQPGYDAKEVKNYLYEKMSFRNTRISLEDYEIYEDDIEDLVNATLSEHEDLYAVRRRQYGKTEDGRVMMLYVRYDASQSDLAFEKAVKIALSNVNDSMSDMEKAIVLHDYIVTNCEYAYEEYLEDDIKSPRYTAYGALVDHLAVCAGYAEAYCHLLNKAGVACYKLTSCNLNHAWNIVTIDGKNYHVDSTWDDPVGTINERGGAGVYGRARHTYFLRNDSFFEENHVKENKDWRVFGLDETGAVYSTYENAWFREVSSPVVILGGKYYFANPESSYYVTFDEKNISEISCEIRSVSAGSISDYTYTSVCTSPTVTCDDHCSSESGLFLLDGRLYFNDTENIYSVNPDGTDMSTVYSKDSLDKNIMCCFFDGMQTAFSDVDGHIEYSDYASVNSKPRDIFFKEDRIFLTPGDSCSLALTVISKNHSEADCIVSGSEPDTVSITGRSAGGAVINVKALKEGITDITASCGGMSCSCTVVVASELPWYENYEYDLDDKQGEITLKKYVGRLSEVTVSAGCVIGGRAYDVVMEAGYDKGFSGSGITAVSFESGVRLKTANYLFYNCTDLKEVDLSGIDTSALTDTIEMFGGCSSLEKIDMKGLDLSAVREMDGMFDGCSSIKEIDFGGYDLSAVTSIRYALNGCTGLEKLTLPSKLPAGLSLSIPMPLFEQKDKVTTKRAYTDLYKAPSGAVLVKSYLNDYSFYLDRYDKVISLMDYIGSDRAVTVPSGIYIDDEEYTTLLCNDTFYCKTEILSVSFQEGVRLEDYSWYLFNGCEKLVSVNMTGVDLSDVIELLYPFRGCSSLERLDMSSLDLTSVSNEEMNFTRYILGDCVRLRELKTPYIPDEGIDISLPFLMADSAGNAYQTLPKGLKDSLVLGVMKSGECGDNVSWAWDEGTLTFSGSGDMTDYPSFLRLPWGCYAGDTDQVVFSEGITRIGAFTLNGFSALKDVYFGGSRMQWERIATAVSGRLSGAGVHFEKVGLAFYIEKGAKADIINTVSGGMIEKPEDPVMNGYTFLGWYDDEDCTREHDFSRPLYEDAAVYAGWEMGGWGLLCEQIAWSLDKEGCLTISGEGEIPDPASYETPWYAVREKIKKLVIEEGITSLPSSIPADMFFLEEIHLPVTLNNITDMTALYNTGINKVYYAGSKKQWQSCNFSTAFYYMEKEFGRYDEDGDDGSSSEKEGSSSGKPYGGSSSMGSSSDKSYGSSSGTESRSDKPYGGSSSTGSASDKPYSDSSSTEGTDGGSSSGKPYGGSSSTGSASDKPYSDSSSTEGADGGSSSGRPYGGSSSSKDESSSDKPYDGSSSAEGGSSSDKPYDGSSSAECGSSSDKPCAGSSSTGDDKDNGSSSGAEYDPGSGKEDSGSSKGGSSGSGDADFETRVKEAVKAGYGSAEDSIGLQQMGSSFVLSIPEGGDEENDIQITLAKGNRFTLKDAVSGSADISNRSVISVNKKNIVRAKKPGSTTLTYRNNNNSIMKLKIIVTDPAIIGVSTGKWKKLTATVSGGYDFDITTSIPLNARFLAPKDPKMSVSELDTQIRNDGRIHITGTAWERGTVTLPFTVNDRKFNLKIKVK